MYHLKLTRLLGQAAMALVAAAPLSLLHAIPQKVSEISDWSVSHASPPDQINLVTDGYLIFLAPSGTATYTVTGGSSSVVVTNTDELITFTYDQGAIGPATVIVKGAKTTLPKPSSTDTFTVA
ncbi:MAG: hypothetical protein P8Y69_08770, partial [Gammaproteobacteria bacterium]